MPFVSFVWFIYLFIFTFKFGCFKRLKKHFVSWYNCLSKEFSTHCIMVQFGFYLYIYFFHVSPMPLRFISSFQLVGRSYCHNCHCHKHFSALVESYLICFVSIRLCVYLQKKKKKNRYMYKLLQNKIGNEWLDKNELHRKIRFFFFFF